jgi:hypothetical protein
MHLKEHHQQKADQQQLFGSEHAQIGILKITLAPMSRLRSIGETAWKP